MSVIVLKNSRGFTLVETFLAVTIISISFLGVISYFNFVDLFQKKIEQESVVLDFRQRLIATIQNEKAWSKTVSMSEASDNPHLLCLKNKTDCSGSGGAIKIRLAAGDVLYDPSANAGGISQKLAGFNKDGQLCYKFDPVNGDSDCPYRFELSWSPLCSQVNPQPCSPVGKNPGIRVNGIFKISGAKTFVKNESSYDFTIYLNGENSGPPPLAINDVYYTNQSVSVPEMDVIENDRSLLGTNSDLQLTWVGYLDEAAANPELTKQANKTWASSVSYFNSSAELNPEGTNTIRFFPGDDIERGSGPFYGLDYFFYEVVDGNGNMSRAKVWVKVMTPYTWTGEGGNQLASTLMNWCGSVAADFKSCQGAASRPDSSNHVVFDDTCAKTKCDAQVNIDLLANRLELAKRGVYGYKGVLTQIAPMRIGNGGFQMRSGEFVGGENDITVSGTYSLIGGHFKSTRGLLTLGRSNLFTSTVMTIENGALFEHNNGTVLFSGNGNGSCDHKNWTMAVPASTTFYSLTMDAADTCWTSSGDARLNASARVVIENRLTLERGRLFGDYDLKGDLVIGSGAHQGTGIIKFIGAGTQKYTYTSGSSGGFVAHGAPILKIDKPSGSVEPNSTSLAAYSFQLNRGIFTAPTGELRIGHNQGSDLEIFRLDVGAQFIHNDGTFVLYGGGNGSCDHKVWRIIVPRSLDLYNFAMDATDSCWISTGDAEIVLSPGPVININNELRFNRGRISSGDFYLRGDLVVGAGAHQGNGIIHFLGAGVQKYTYTSGASGGGVAHGAPVLRVTKPGGNVEPNSADLAAHSFILDQGVFTAPTGEFRVGHNLDTTMTLVAVKPGTLYFQNGGTLHLYGGPAGGSTCGPIKDWTIDFPSPVTLNKLKVSVSSDCGTPTAVRAPSGKTINVTALELISGQLLGPGTWVIP